YLGVWNGTGVQNNGLSWTASISLFGRVGPIVGTINYLSSDCGGELTLLSASADAVELSEKLTYSGGDPCVNGGVVTLRLQQNGTLAYTWGQGVFQGTATGTLSKVIREARVQLTWFDRTGKVL